MSVHRRRRGFFPKKPHAMQNGAVTSPGATTVYGINQPNGDGYYYTVPVIGYYSKQLKQVGPLILGDHHNPNSWSYEVYEEVGPSGSILASDVGPGPTRGSYSVQVGNPGSARFELVDFNPYYEDAYARALSSLNDNVRGGMDLSVDAFQAKQNKKMLSAVGRVEEFARKTPLLRRVGSAWLELQYGWKPLVQDLYGIIDETTRVLINKIERYRGYGKSSFDLRYISASNAPNCSAGGSIKGHVTVKLGIACEVPDFDLARWTSLNPASIAWELLPYSFVVDWFIDIGGSMRALETALAYGQRFRGGFESKFMTQEAGYRDINTGQDGDILIQVALGARLHQTLFVRNVLGSYPLPHLPSIRPHLGSGRLLNAAGLLSQFLGRK
jgi:hypothetical protein